jgi:hypothetical protein
LFAVLAFLTQARLQTSVDVAALEKSLATTGKA